MKDAFYIWKNCLNSELRVAEHFEYEMGKESYWIFLKIPQILNCKCNSTYSYEAKCVAKVYVCLIKIIILLKSLCPLDRHLTHKIMCLSWEDLGDY